MPRISARPRQNVGTFVAPDGFTNDPWAFRMSNRTGAAARAAIVTVPALLSIFICLHGLSDKPLWLDEVITYNRSNLPVADLIANSLHSKQLPGYFIVEKYFDGPIINEWALRFPSTVFTALSVLIIGLIAAEIASPIAGLFAGSIAALAPINVQFGQEARPYALAGGFIMFALWGLHRIIRAAECQQAQTLRSSRLGWAAYGLSTIAATNVILVSVIWFLVANIVMGAIFVISPHARIIVRKWLIWQIVIALALVPALVGIYHYSGHDPFDGHRWVPASTLQHIWSVLSAAYFFRFSDVSSFALLDSRAPWLGSIVAALACWGTYQLRHAWKFATLLVASAAAMPIALLLISVFHPFWVTRYLLWSIGPYCVLAGIGLYHLPRYASAASAMIVLAGGLMNLAPYYTADTKPRWDMAAQYLASRASSGELIVMNDKAAHYVLAAYTRRYVVEPLNIVTGPDLPSDVPSNGIWAVYGRTGQGAIPPKSVLLQSWSAQGNPNEHVKFGKDIIAIHFDESLRSAQADNHGRERQE